MIEEYIKLEKGDYTDESWKAFQDALSAAKEVSGRPNTAQAEIDKAEQEYQKAP